MLVKEYQVEVDSGCTFMQVANRVFLADKRVIPSSGRGKSSAENDPFKTSLECPMLCRNVTGLSL